MIIWTINSSPFSCHIYLHLLSQLHASIFLFSKINNTVAPVRAVHTLLSVRHLLDCCWSSKVMFLKKTDFPFLRNHQSSIGPQLVTRAHKPLPFHARMLSGLILCLSCAVIHRCYEFMNLLVLSHLKGTVLLWSSLTSDFYNHSFPSSMRILILGDEA